MEFWSYVIAVILGLSAIISPIITTLINNAHQSDMKKIEIYELSKQNSLKDFIKCSTSCYNSSSPVQISAYYNSLYNLYLYFSKIPNEVHSLLDYTDRNDFNYELRIIVSNLSKQIAKE